ncbi:GvpL/GvpF family gas vesicle protein [Alteribacillus iranensis]|uniref:Gas vesicle synthesis protein GvpL/GvpF n=1 Tax=Alteribacillus iranensis TaxID=930128 RepID=A0A1I2AC39_9BACI|nr:GvpL/GvpF family gas vesicle protein [Alteribacillus iranensis]SFE41456.1 Gas vesicle synthesis protein GvpL/GvpF [Alteribacillus iranensis]
MQAETNTEELTYLYAFIPTDEYEKNPFPERKGMDPEYTIKCLPFDTITAVTCPVSHQEFSEEVLQKKVDNMQWLQEKAFHHHEMMNTLHAEYTVIPLKFATIYEKTDSLEQVIEEKKEHIHSIFHEISNQEEWNIKIYTVKDEFTQRIETYHPDIEQKKQEIEGLSRGKQFFEKKKLKELILMKAEEEIDEYCERIHEQLMKWSTDHEIKKNWERKLTGRTDDMCWNGAYLLPKEKVKSTLSYIEEERERARKKVFPFTFEVTGPWPAYHFSNFINRGEQSGG